jgi:hypothetical protein
MLACDYNSITFYHNYSQQTNLNVMPMHVAHGKEMIALRNNRFSKTNVKPFGFPNLKNVGPFLTLKNCYELAG